MRILPLIIASFPTLLMADDIPLISQVSDVTVYPDGAKVTRRASFDAPAGQHQLIIADLPANTPVEALRLEVEGAKMGTVTVRRNYVPPRDAIESPELKTAKAEVERIEAAIWNKTHEVKSVLLARDAANARIAFLGQIGSGDSFGQTDLDKLREIARMVGEETRTARGEALETEIAERALQQEIEDLNEDLAKAEQAVEALVPEDEERAYVAVAIDADTGGAGDLTISYVIDQARWEPVYDMRLTRGDSPDLSISRGAYVMQQTGENWRDVNLILSTVRPSAQSTPGELWPWLRQIAKPEPVQPKTNLRAMSGADARGFAAPEMASPIMAESAQANFNGLSVSYSYPGPVDIATEADAVRLSLGELSVTPKVHAWAVPLQDSTAFLMAEFTNDTDELLLPASAALYLDGDFVGNRTVDLIAAGAKSELSFGPIEGLQLKRTVLDKSEGDRGVITKSNQQVETVKIEVENLTAEDWDLRLLDRVPYSEQDDLQITWKTTPAPSETNVDGKRGILAWDMEIAASETREIILEQTLNWPSEMLLR